jgi:hypothetical protein
MKTVRLYSVITWDGTWWVFATCGTNVYSLRPEGWGDSFKKDVETILAGKSKLMKTTESVKKYVQSCNIKGWSKSRLHATSTGKNIIIHDRANNEADKYIGLTLYLKEYLSH